MKILKIWLDDIRPAPGDFMWCKSVNQIKDILESAKASQFLFEIILDLDHDMGDFASDGGDAIELLDWMLENEFQYNALMEFKFHFHTANPVGEANMRRLVVRHFGEENLI